MAFSSQITIDGKPVVLSVPRGSKAWKKANSIFCPLGPAPTRAWFLMTKSYVDAMSATGTKSIVWKTTSDDGLFDQTMTFSGFYLKSAERLTHGAVGDTAALYLVELADSRWPLNNNGDTGIIATNCRGYQDISTYIAGTGSGTWTTLTTALWNACALLGSFPSSAFPASIPLDGVPESHWYLGLNSWRTLCALLDQLDCAVVPSQITGTWTLTQLGGAQTISAGANTLKWDGEPKTYNAGQAATLNVYFKRYYKDFARERYGDVNWPSTGHVVASSAATGITGGVGTKAVWDDLPALIDADGTDSNSSARTTRRDNRKSRYVTRVGVTQQHRIHQGLTGQFLPGGKIRAALWRNWDDHEENDLGGTVTEFVAGPDLITDIRANDCGYADFETAMPLEREPFAPPDLSRWHYPVFERSFFGKASGTISAGGTGTVRIWTPDFATNTGVDVSAVNYSLTVALASGDKVLGGFVNATPVVAKIC